MAYKEWCPICVAVEGIHNQPRRRTADVEKEQLGITISMELCFLNLSEEVEKDPKVLVVHDNRLGCDMGTMRKHERANPQKQ